MYSRFICLQYHKILVWLQRKAQLALISERKGRSAYYQKNTR